MIPFRLLTTLMKLSRGHVTRAPIATALPNVTIWSSPMPRPAAPAIFEPKFYLLIQGRKRLAIGGRVLDFGVGECAVSSISLPFTSEVVEASAGAPYIGVEVRPRTAILADLLADMPTPSAPDTPAFSSTSATLDLVEAVCRLVRLLESPCDIPLLHDQLERELCYRLLQSPLGGTLRQVMHNNARFEQIRSAIQWIRDHAHETMQVGDLARSVGMSLATFHRHFKAVTAYSPLAFQRHIRLMNAQRLIVSGQTNVTGAAFATGYLSPSQFSREYKRMFGASPARTRQPRSRLASEIPETERV